MSLPDLAVSLVGSFVGALTEFFASRAGTILSGMGFTAVGYKGLSSFVDYLVAQVMTVVNQVNALGGSVAGASDFGAVMVALAAYAGLFDALNIVLAGGLAALSVAQMKFVFTRLLS